VLDRAAPRQDRRVDCAELLRNARWHAGLTQAEVAARAGTSQQALARYERGHSAPSVAVLERLLAASGMRLRAALEPEPGLEDEPTLELLDAQPLDRLPVEYAEALPTLCGALADAGLPALIAGKGAARLVGAVVRVWELDVWLDRHAVPLPVLVQALNAAGAFDLGLGGRRMPVESHGPALTEELVVFLNRIEIRLTGVFDFDRSRTRALQLPLGAHTALVAPLDEVVACWHPRDRDRLALQRALRLRERRATPDQV
jgi:transcriptional regulator with XRE-family HTH domain